MVQRIHRVLILEDKPEHAIEIQQYIKSEECLVDVVNTAEQAYERFSDRYDCYAFDINIREGRVGHQILLEGIGSGNIRVPCIIITGDPNITQLQEDYGDLFMAFIPKQHGWVEVLNLKIIELAGNDMREHYMTYKFTKLNAMDFEIKMNNSWGYGNEPIQVRDVIKLLGKNTITEEIKGLIYDELAALSKRIT